eukprot:1157515-Pelagomonas_calceolata.AAC.5
MALHPLCLRSGVGKAQAEMHCIRALRCPRWHINSTLLAFRNALHQSTPMSMSAHQFHVARIQVLLARHRQICNMTEQQLQAEARALWGTPFETNDRGLAESQRIGGNLMGLDSSGGLPEEAPVIDAEEQTGGIDGDDEANKWGKVDGNRVVAERPGTTDQGQQQHHHHHHQRQHQHQRRPQGSRASAHEDLRSRLIQVCLASAHEDLQSRLIRASAHRELQS